MNGETKIADSIGIYNFHGYNFNSSPSGVSYRLGQLAPATESADSQFASYFEGSVIVPDDIVQTWGADDDPIITYVIQSLNLEKE